MAEDRADDGTHSTAMVKDGVTALPSEDANHDKAAQELDDAHEHADPSRGDKDADGDGRVKSDDQSQSAGAADEQATTFKRSI